MEINLPLFITAIPSVSFYIDAVNPFSDYHLPEISGNGGLTGIVVYGNGKEMSNRKPIPGQRIVDFDLNGDGGEMHILISNRQGKLTTSSIPIMGFQK